MSEQPEKLFIVTQQDELDYWKRKYHELLDYLEGKNMGEESKQETPEKEYHEWMRRSGGGVEVRRSDGTIIDTIGEIERLIALLREAEAKHESAQKMADHWEEKTAYWKSRAEEAETARSNRSVLLGKIESIINAADVGKYHPANEIGECKLMTLAERVESLAESRNNLEELSYENLARAEKAEAERDEWKRRAGNAEFEVKRQKDLANPVDWGRVRIDAAIATMQGMWACPDTNFMRPMEVIAVECADSLVAELQKKEVQR